ncbi:MAG: biotin transporter BioY [Oscillospiraceae bacterium]|jgi:biotin transport system substrate-specific component|nr:biotin transporter BioY [Oscillospiraceae bacterium]
MEQVSKKAFTKLSIHELCYIAIFVAIIAACAQIVIPQPGGVPFTLQAWAISLAGLVLGVRKGTIAAIVYVVLGVVGAPVFASFSGGFGAIMRPSGGFILSFPVVALLAGLGERKSGLHFIILGLAAGSIFNWAIGLIWFNWITGFGLWVSFGYAVAPFIVVGVVRTAVLPFISKGIKTAMKKSGLKIEEQ